MTWHKRTGSNYAGELNKNGNSTTLSYSSVKSGLILPTGVPKQAMDSVTGLNYLISKKQGFSSCVLSMGTKPILLYNLNCTNNGLSGQN